MRPCSNPRRASAPHQLTARAALLTLLAFIGLGATCQPGSSGPSTPPDASSRPSPDASTSHDASAALDPCPEGQLRPDDVHCCWPAQQWSQQRDACLGEPSCPDTHLPTADDCLPRPEGWRGLAQACRAQGVEAACPLMVEALREICDGDVKDPGPSAPAPDTPDSATPDEAEQSAGGAAAPGRESAPSASASPLGVEALSAAEACGRLADELAEAPVESPASVRVGYHTRACEGGVDRHCLDGGRLALAEDVGQAERLWTVGCGREQRASCLALLESRVSRCRRAQSCQWDGFEEAAGVLDALEPQSSAAARRGMCVAWVWSQEPIDGEEDDPCRGLTRYALDLAEAQESAAAGASVEASDAARVNATLEVACAGVEAPPTGHPEVADPQACLKLALRLERGPGVSRERAAVALFRKACSVGLSEACMHLGRFYASGVVVTRNERRAAGFFRAACDDGVWRGCTLLAQLMVEGRGVPADALAGVDLLERACQADEPFACHRLGQLLIQGPPGVAADLARGQRLIRAACERGVRAACPP